MGPYRGAFGAPRPDSLRVLALPPAPMPARDGLRPLKSWRYVGVYGPELMLCAAAIRIGPARQSFWAIWDRREHRLRERTRLGRGHVRLGGRSATIAPLGGATKLKVTVTVSPGQKVLKTKSLVKLLSANHRLKVTLVFKSSALSTIRKALAHHKQVTAQVDVGANNSTGTGHEVYRNGKAFRVKH